MPADGKVVVDSPPTEGVAHRQLEHVGAVGDSPLRRPGQPVAAAAKRVARRPDRVNVAPSALHVQRLEYIELDSCIAVEPEADDGSIAKSVSVRTDGCEQAAVARERGRAVAHAQVEQTRHRLDRGSGDRCRRERDRGHGDQGGASCHAASYPCIRHAYGPLTIPSSRAHLRHRYFAGR